MTFVGVRASQSLSVPAINPATLSWEVLLDSRSIPPIANGAPIPLWPDTSGKGRDANPVPGFNPLYRPASSPTGLALADFGPVATGRQMFGTLPVGGVGNTLGFSFYSWYVIDTLNSAGAGDGMFIFDASTGSGFGLGPAGFVSPGVMRPFALTSAGGVQGGSSSLGVHMLTCICTPPAGTGVCQVFHDGALVATGTWNANPNTNYLISGNSVQNIPLNGRAGFVGFRTAADSSRTRQGIEKFLKQTWG